MCSLFKQVNLFQTIRRAAMRLSSSHLSIPSQLSSDLPQALPLVQLQGAVDLPGPVDGVCVARVVGAYCCGWWLCRCVTSWSSSHSSMSLFRSMKLLDLSQSQPSEDLRHQPCGWGPEGLHCPHDRCPA